MMMMRGRRGFSSSSLFVKDFVLFLLLSCFLLGIGAEEDGGLLNEIQVENMKEGQGMEHWDISGAGDLSLQGFATASSYVPGETVYFKIKTDSRKYRIDIYRIGYYNGDGARKVGGTRANVRLPQNQPDCYFEEETKLYDCGNWGVSARWFIPDSAVSGVYFARLVREDQPKIITWREDGSKSAKDPRFENPDNKFEKPKAAPHAYGASGHGKLKNKILEPYASHIYFVVRQPERKSDILVQVSDITWQAYNTYGGTSTYGSFNEGDIRPRAFKASLNRPLANREHRPTNTIWATEYPLIRWLEKNGYDVSYQSGFDTARLPLSNLLKYKVFISSGHDEYWERQQRRNVEAARDAGVHLMFLSGNEMFWKVRFEPSHHDLEGKDPLDCLSDDKIDQRRTMVCYKESQASTKIDPKQDEWTGTWRDSREINPEGAQPENAVTGTIFTVNAWRDDPLLVPSEYRVHRFWRNTSVASLSPGEVRVLKQGLLGHEWDEDIDNGFRPKGLAHLSRTFVDNVMYIQDFGSLYDSGSATHHLTMYKHESGAIVFGAGTCQWSWGLDPFHQFGSFPHIHNYLNPRIGLDIGGSDRNVEQATANLLADMGVFPLSLAPYLVFPSASSDTEPPSSRITTPMDGATVILDPSRIVYVHIEAVDTGLIPGCVAAVEVSTDGETWHPARRFRPDQDVPLYGPHFSEDECNPTWVYKWTVPKEKGPFHLLSRAFDDSGNHEFVPPSGEIGRQKEGGKLTLVQTMGA